MQSQTLHENWKFHQIGDESWLNAQVPGSVHLDLFNAGRIPDPFIGENEYEVQWIIDNDWEYQLEFTPTPGMLAKEKIFLVFDGIDTLATVKLNGEVLGTTENMFREYQWDVKDLLRESTNQLSIVFNSLREFMDEKMAERAYTTNVMGVEGGYYVRKAPCQFGWDWGPALPPIGLWKPVHLDAYDTAKFTDIHLQQRHADQMVTISAAVELDQWSDEAIQIEMLITAPTGDTYTTIAHSPAISSTLSYTIEHPELWYPNGYGQQPLYQVEIILRGNESVLDHKQYQLGLRTLELVQKPDEWGKSFTFVVNGIPIWAKGANWIPADTFPTRISRQRMERWIHDTALGNQNMLRVWGGGFYESDDFYDLCDQYGVLVWQDCIFACKIYPLHQPEFVENTRLEIIDNVRRIRHHASLALWCGNNEMEWGWESWSWDKPEYADLKTGYDVYFHYLLPQWIKDLDPDTAYWPSSPSSDQPFKNVNGQIQGDAHYWDVWHQGAPFTAYRDQYPRFMSEFGFQSFPPMETIKTYAKPEDWNLTSPVMESHQKNNNGNRFIINQMTATYRVPTNFESLMYMSMVLQAEGIRYGVEHWRRNNHRVSGTLYWQLNDCWPVASWASIDYFGRWKALHYSAKRFYEPVLLSLFDEGSHISIHLTNDTVNKWDGQISWAWTKLDGEILESGQKPISVTALKSAEVEVVDLPVTKELERDSIFICNLVQNGVTVSTQISTFIPTKQLNLTEANLDWQITQSGDQFHLRLKTSSLSRFIELKLEGADVIFSDNYFDLPAGQERVITCAIPEGWTLDHAKQSFRWTDVYHSYAA